MTEAPCTVAWVPEGTELVSQKLARRPLPLVLVPWGAYYRSMTTDATRDPELFDAIAAAYALVVTASNELGEVEIERLQVWGTEQGFDGSDIEDLTNRCQAYGRGLFSHPERNRPLAFQRVRKAREGGKRATLVLSAGRVAVVADARIEEAEELVLKKIASELGLDPESA